MVMRMDWLMVRLMVTLKVKVMRMVIAKVTPKAMRWVKLMLTTKHSVIEKDLHSDLLTVTKMHSVIAKVTPKG